VLVLESMAEEEGRPYNEVKLEVLAGAHLFCAVQGGGAHVLAHSVILCLRYCIVADRKSTSLTNEGLTPI
jgi:hypothetical protein